MVKFGLPVFLRFGLMVKNSAYWFSYDSAFRIRPYGPVCNVPISTILVYWTSKLLATLINLPVAAIASLLVSNQCCHIWRFIANLATFDPIWLPKFCLWLLVLFGYFFGYFKKLAKNLF